MTPWFRTTVGRRPTKARHAMLVALAAAFVVTSVAAAGPEIANQRKTTQWRPTGARLVLTEAGVRFSFRVPRPGWEHRNSIPTKKSLGRPGCCPGRGRPISLNKSIVGPQDAEAIIYWTSFPDGDYADPCARLLPPSIGRSAANLAAAVSKAPGTKLIKGPLNVTLGGHHAKHVVLSVRENVGCNPGVFYTWNDAPGGAFWRTTEAGATIRVWIVAVGGTRLFIAAATKKGVRLKRQVSQIVESIRFCCA
jgi:hypothetical protein